MARIVRGPNQTRRKGAKNFIHEEAQRRLDEVVKPFNKQVENSLFVNAVHIEYYQINDKIGKPCTCNKVEVRQEHQTHISNNSNPTNTHTVATEDNTNSGVNIRLQDDNLFGDSEAEKLYGETRFDVTGYDGPDTPYSKTNNDITDSYDDDIPKALLDLDNEGEGDSAYTETSMFGTSAACGICYRAGFQPGYTTYGKNRIVLTTWDFIDMEGYHINNASTPNDFTRQGEAASKWAFVEFEILVPKYFKSCKFSIRNNLEILEEKLYIHQQPLTLNSLRKLAGQRVQIRIVAEQFTHVVIEFDQGLERIRANIGSETQALDYTRLEALSNFPVVLPPSINMVNNGDVIYIPDRRLVLKIVDKERKITASKRQIEWMVQTRVVQRSEPIRAIYKGYNLL